SSLGISVDTRGDIRVSSSNNDGAMASESAIIPIPSPYSPQANEKPRQNRDAPLSRPTVRVTAEMGVGEGSDTTRRIIETRVGRRDSSEPTILPPPSCPFSEETLQSTITTNVNAGKDKEKERQPTSESSNSSPGTSSSFFSATSVSPVDKSTTPAASTTPPRAFLNKNGKRKEPDLDQDESTLISCSTLEDVPGPSSTSTDVPAPSTGIDPQAILLFDSGTRDRKECVGKGKETQRGTGVNFSPQSSTGTVLFGSMDSMIQKNDVGSTGPSAPCPTRPSGFDTQRGGGVQNLEVRDKGKGKQREDTTSSGDAQKPAQCGGIDVLRFSMASGSESFPPRSSLFATQAPELFPRTNHRTYPHTNSTLFDSNFGDTISAGFPSATSSSINLHTLKTSNVLNPSIFGQNNTIVPQAFNLARNQPVTTGSSILPDWETLEWESRVLWRYQAISCMPYYRGTSFEELRVQDYQQNRKAPSAGSFGGIHCAVKNADSGPSALIFEQNESTHAFGITSSRE
ncbi:hypothetical protein AAF712_016692, partial [Marasmius tenuissimus]